MNRRNFLFSVLGIGAIVKTVRPETERERIIRKFGIPKSICAEFKIQENAENTYGGYMIPIELQDDLFRHRNQFKLLRLFMQKKETIKRNGETFL
ncbi:hypothetical protein JNL27_14580 [bacterium]|nr:hypothetical protein [bacterium]